MTDSVLPGFFLTFFGDGSGAELCVAAVGLDLPEGSHSPSGRRIGFVSSFCIRTVALTCLPLKLVAKSVSAAGECVLAHKAAAIASGSIPWLCHQARSLPRRCSSRWCSRQIGTVKRSLTLRLIARCSANLRWWASEGLRPQTRQPC